MTGGNLRQKLPWIFLSAAVLAACTPAGGNPGEGEEITVTQAVEVVEEKVGDDGVVETQEVIVVEEVVPTDTPMPEADTSSRITEDNTKDCATPSGDPVECEGIDISIVMGAIVSNADELAIFNQEAGEGGFVLADTTIAYDFPAIVIGIIVLDFDPEAGFFCINWVDQQTRTPPERPEANVQASCHNEQYDFRYNNIVTESGEGEVVTDPEGTEVTLDPNIGLTVVQSFASIVESFPEDKVDILAVANDNSRHDQFRLEPEMILDEEALNEALEALNGN